jgi:hypothetical protein
MNINQWAIHHLEITSSEAELNPSDAYESAKKSNEWTDYQAVLDWRGWTTLVDEVKRTWKSARLSAVLEKLKGQMVFEFLDGAYSIMKAGAKRSGFRLVKTEKMTFPEFQEAIEIRKQSRKSDTQVIVAMESFLDLIAPIWSAKQGLTLEEVIELI